MKVYKVVIAMNHAVLVTGTFFLIFLLAFSSESFSQKLKLIPVDEFGNEIPIDTSKGYQKMLLSY